MPEIQSAEWDRWLEQYPDCHLLQTAPWGDLKSAFGWRPLRFVSGSAGAQVLIRQLPLGMRFAYLPKGPVGSQRDWPELLREVGAACRAQRAIWLLVEPDAWEGNAAPIPTGFRAGIRPVQPARTIVVDLQADEDVLLANMKQKTRYNIRLSQKKGVQVRARSDIDLFYGLMQTTGQRDGFGVHSRAYYQRSYDVFHHRREGELLVAEFEGEPLAALLVFGRGERAWYLHGASSDAHRELMPTYLLQWEAMRWARSHGCVSYDLWGVPDANEIELEANFTQRSDGLWGVYRFKRGFGGQVLRSAPPWEQVFNPILYAFYRWWISRKTTRDEAPS